MDLSLGNIYLSAIRGIRAYPLIYLLLFAWGVVQGIILFLVLSLGAGLWMANLALIAGDPSFASNAFYITLTFLTITLGILTILSAATRAGVLSYGARIRRGLKPGAGDFFRGILRFTLPLFIGGIVVGMLTAIPTLGFLLIAKYELAGSNAGIFSSGWNYTQSLMMIRFLWNLMLAFGTLQTLIFFWITPWDEMVVLHEIPYPEALARAFGFVFSRRHFLRVVGLVISNVVLAQIIFIMANIVVFIQGIPNGFAYAYLSALMSSSQNTIASFLQFILLPFFAYSQLFLLPRPEPKKSVVEPEKSVYISAMDNPKALPYRY